MRQKMKILTTTVGLLTLNGFTGLAHAQLAPPTSTIAFPMVGIGFNQTLQLNVISLPSGPCRMQLAIFDSNGATVASGSVGPPQTIGFQYGSLKIDSKTRFPAFRSARNFAPRLRCSRPRQVRASRRRRSRCSIISAIPTGW
jgi:hypothetical protein